ncbi:MAG: hypothetical protein ACOYKI_05225 [Sediminibacterium sp.]
MKFKYLFILSILLNLNSQAQTNIKDNESVLQYLMEKVLLSEDAKKRIIIIPLATEDIKNFIHNDNREIKYWSVLNKYYPTLSKDSLKKMIDEAVDLEKFMLRDFPNLVYITNKSNYTIKNINEKYNNAPIIFISNFIYSNDKKACIFYVHEYNEAGYTVEIKQDNTGKWNICEITGDWIV